ncbi:MAG: AAA family ATPase [Deltaproteobacteria bacterium]|nr:AAA family ATPase [Deltaproteobacteria bacterium]
MKEREKISLGREGLEKISTGVPNLDRILNGGIPKYSVNIIAGPPGTGKTILAQQIVFANTDENSSAPYLVTVSEPTVKLIRYQQQFSYFDKGKLTQNVHYLDIGTSLLRGGIDEVDKQIEEYINEYNPTILVIDSFKAIHEAADTPSNLREFSYKLAVRLATWECTSFLVGEYGKEDINTAPVFAIADGIIFMDREERGMQTLRQLEVIKMRGDGYDSGRHPFKITKDGIQVFPRIKTPAEIPNYEVASTRVSSGIEGLDDMMESGILQGTVTLVAGSAGTGKTLLGLHFLLEGIKHGEPGVLVTFQEVPSLIKTFASGFGWDLEQMEREGLLKILYTSPVEMGVDEHAATIKETINQMKAKRIVIDSLKDIEIATPDKVRYKDYIYSLVNFFRAEGVTSLVTNEISELFGAFVMSEYGISFISDNVILLRYVEIESRISRAISVLKMRGSNHAKDVREFRISAEGMEILEPFREYGSILSGAPKLSTIPGADNLPPKSRQVLNMFRGMDKVTAEMIAQKMGMDETQVMGILTMLTNLGFVTKSREGNKDYYKTSVLWT